MKKTFYLVCLILLSILASCSGSGKENKPSLKEAREVWSSEQAQAWYSEQGWLRGANFTPSTAVNQLEMWQEESFDPETIDRELGYAERIGFNSMRVYLHHLAWKTDPEGFKKRMSQYLVIADQHGISTLFVFFDDCWNATYQSGKQPEPKPGVHNSGWVRDPGDLIHAEPELAGLLERYVKDIMTTFADDSRIVLWDVYNEPGNSGYGSKSMPLLEKVFAWGREVNPSQPLSAGVWNWSLAELSRFQIDNSDVITYHNYGDPENHRKMIDTLQTLTAKPLICTEYMARTQNSFFGNIMPLLKEHQIGAYNWGLVSGKTNTIYAWSTPILDGSEPALWFHDIFRNDGTPYRQEEVDVIRQLTEIP